MWPTCIAASVFYVCSWRSTVKVSFGNYSCRTAALTSSVSSQTFNSVQMLPSRNNFRGGDMDQVALDHFEHRTYNFAVARVEAVSFVWLFRARELISRSVSDPYCEFLQEVLEHPHGRFLPGTRVRTKGHVWMIKPSPSCKCQCQTAGHSWQTAGNICPHQLTGATNTRQNLCKALPDPCEDPKSRSTLGFHNLHHNGC